MLKTCKRAISLFAIVGMLLFTQLAWADAATPLPENGEYTVAAKLDGGSGRASVQSPANLKVENGKGTLTITMSSSTFDKLVYGGVEYKPTNTSGNSVFSFPISELGDISLSMETVAMSEPHMIDYTLSLDASSIAKVNGSDGGFPTEWIFIGLGIVIVALAIVIGNKFRR